MAGRWIAGSGQLILALTGFGFFVVWFAKTMVQYYGMITNDAPVTPVGWIGLTGLWIFVAAWLWSLVTSFSLLREARQNEAALPVPPKL